MKNGCKQSVLKLKHKHKIKKLTPRCHHAQNFLHSLEYTNTKTYNHVHGMSSRDEIVTFGTASASKINNTGGPKCTEQTPRTSDRP